VVVPTRWYPLETTPPLLSLACYVCDLRTGVVMCVQPDTCAGAVATISPISARPVEAASHSMHITTAVIYRGGGLVAAAQLACVLSRERRIHVAIASCNPRLVRGLGHCWPARGPATPPFACARPSQRFGRAAAAVWLRKCSTGRVTSLSAHIPAAGRIFVRQLGSLAGQSRVPVAIIARDPCVG
jgi:hypothetical protein